MRVRKKVPKKKVPAKKGGRRTEIQTPNSNADPPIETRKANQPVRATVRAGEVKPMLNATMWRVRNEIYPGSEGIRDARLNSDEEAYILMLHMFLGNENQQPRRGLKISHHDFNGDLPLCREHR